MNSGSDVEASLSCSSIEPENEQYSPIHDRKKGSERENMEYSTSKNNKRFYEEKSLDIEALENNKRSLIAIFQYTINSWLLSFIFKSYRKGIDRNKLLKTYAKHPYRSNLIRLEKEQSYFSEKTHESNKETKSSSKMIKSILKVIKNVLLASMVFRLLSELTNLYLPFVMSKLLTHLENEDPEIEKSFWLCILMFILSVCSSLFNNYASQLMMSEGVSLKMSLDFLIYKKLLKTQYVGKNTFSPGKILNLVSNDTTKIELFSLYLHTLLVIPINLIMILGFLFYFLGYTIVFGILTILVSLFIQKYTASRMRNETEKFMEIGDKRVELTRELISGIKTIKSYALEERFKEKINEMRRGELWSIAKIQSLKSYLVVVAIVLPSILSIVTFSMYQILGNKLAPDVVFPTIALFNILRVPILCLPFFISMLYETLVSIGRISSFLNEKEVVCYVRKDESKLDKDTAVEIRNGTFSFSEEGDSILKDINLSIPKHKVTAIIGKVGSGKTALLKAMTGEIQKIKGEVLLSGDLSYCPTKTWIINSTIRNNITFGSKLNKSHYKKVLRDCLLDQDIKRFPKNDLTFIGERGVNISGGQRQRIGLARTIYNSKEIVILDDPFSSLFEETTRDIFRDAVRKTMKDKTIIITTNNLHVVKNSDWIVIIEDGKIKRECKPDELVDALYPKVLLDTEGGSNLQEKADVPSEEFQDVEDEDEEEDVMRGRIKGELYRQYIGYFGRAYKSVITLLLFIVWNISKVYVLLWLSKWVRFEYPSLTNANYVQIYACLAVLHGFLYILYYRSLVIKSCISASKRIHESVLNKVSNASMEFFYNTNSGQLISRFSKDFPVIDMFLPNSMMMFSSTLGGCISGFLLVAIVAPISIAIIFPLILIYYFIQKVVRKVLIELRRIHSYETSNQHSFFSETMNGIETIRTSKMEEKHVQKSKHFIKRRMAPSFVQVFLNRWLEFRLELIGNIAVFVISMACLFLKIDATLSGLIISNSMTISSSLSFAIKHIMDIEMNMNSLERLLAYFKNVDSEHDDTEHLVITEKGWLKHGEITFKNVYLKYKNNENPILNNISFKINEGERIRILGETGAGKSSIILILLRLFDPISGEVTIDDIDIKKIGKTAIRSDITFISQDPLLFNGTIRSNIDPDGIATDEKMNEIIERTSLYPILENMSEGLDTQILDTGKNFSTGQRQLISLARAMLKNTKILIMDEATSSIDKDTDRFIQDSIQNYFEGVTIISITHKLDSTIKFDKEMVIKKGFLVEMGSPEELLSQKNSEYYKIMLRKDD